LLEGRIEFRFKQDPSRIPLDHLIDNGALGGFSMIAESGLDRGMRIN
jgi:hypothetical protein